MAIPETSLTRARFLRVTARAERLVIRLVPHEAGIAAMGNDVVDTAVGPTVCRAQDWSHPALLMTLAHHGWEIVGTLTTEGMARAEPTRIGVPAFGVALTSGTASAMLGTTSRGDEGWAPRSSTGAEHDLSSSQ